jgi:hypothetical protein
LPSPPGRPESGLGPSLADTGTAMATVDALSTNEATTR